MRASYQTTEYLGNANCVSLAMQESKSGVYREFYNLIDKERSYVTNIFDHVRKKYITYI